MDKQSNESAFKSVVKWIASSFEEVSGKASHRKLTTFSFVVLFWVMILLTYKTGNVHTFNEFQWGLTFSGAVGMSSLRILEKRLNRKA